MPYYADNGGLIGPGKISSKTGVFDLVAAQVFGDALYPFTTFTFSNAGVTGRNGPTLAQCQTAYAGQTFLNGFFNVTTQGQQLWTVPASGTYNFVVRGANGVPSTGASSGCSGGQGIILSFSFSLTQGEVLELIVGQSGTATSLHGGGGGATAVLRSPYNTTDSIIAIAGGGGGRRQASTGVGIPGASFTTYAGYGTSNNTNSNAGIGTITVNGPGGITGFTNLSGVTGGGVTLGFGGASADSNYGDSGAGFFGNGRDDGTGSTVSQSISGTAVGGFGASGADGGFGGGGDGAGGNGGGGGGGYTGGNGGHTAGGGGSYRNVSVTNYAESFDGNATTIGSNTTLYHGYITITKV